MEVKINYEKNENKKKTMEVRINYDKNENIIAY
jgi:hypothetical protein